MTQPDTLHTRLRAEINRRREVARAAENSCYHIDDCDGAISEFLEVDGPAASARRLERELQTLERHTPTDIDAWRYGITCKGCPNSAVNWPCFEIKAVAGRLGVSVDG